MGVKTTELGVATYFAPDGPLFKEKENTIEESVRATIAKGTIYLVIDFKNVPYLDSQSIEYIVDLDREVREEGGSLRLANMNSLCRETMMVTGFDQTLSIHDDLEGAGRSFL